MRKFFLILMLSVSLQAISMNFQAQALSVQDEINACLDADVGVLVSIDIQSVDVINLELEKSYLVFGQGYLKPYLINDLIDTKETPYVNRFHSKDCSKVLKKPNITKTLNRSSGGIPA